MSSNTKIVVLKSKELIYTGIFIVLGILLVLLLFYMFSPSDSEADAGKKQTSSPTEQSNTDENPETITTYSPGVYTSDLNLGGSALQLTVTVDETTVTNVSIANLDETITTMYPLIQPSLDEINSQISVVSNIDEITYSKDNQYTTIIIMDAVKQALSAAEKK